LGCASVSELLCWLPASMATQAQVLAAEVPLLLLLVLRLAL
jgi:hypothetical protein